MIQPTKRLVFREWLPDDWLRFKPIANDPRVVRYVVHGAVPTDEQIRAHIEAARKQYWEEGFCLWPLVYRANQKLIGFCGLDHLWEGPEIEIGYWLAHAYWGNGLATEAAQAVLDYGFGKLGLQRIVAVAHPENRASLRVLHKLEMTFERMAVHQGVEHVLYSKSADISIST
jgi:[ribosomal protein S5]-alanine N-acetyltransferase